MKWGEGRGGTGEPGMGQARRALCTRLGLGNEYRWWHEMVCQGELKATREINIVQSSWGINFT